MEVLKVIAVGKIKKGDAVIRVKEIFKVGDIVSWHGTKGEIVKEDENKNNLFPLFVKLEDCEAYSLDQFTFSRDGKHMPFHKESSLILIKRFKKFIAFEDWKTGTQYKTDGDTRRYIKFKGLPFCLTTHSYPDNINFFIKNKFYEVE